MTSWRCTVIIGKSHGLSHEGRVTQDAAKNVQYWLKTCFLNWGSWSHQKLFMTCCQRWKDQRRQRTIIASHTGIYLLNMSHYCTQYLHSICVTASFTFLWSSRTDVLKPFMPGVSFWLTFILSFLQHVLFAGSWMWVLHAVTTTQQDTPK